MLIPIICKSCGKQISAYYDAWIEMRTAEIKKLATGSADQPHIMANMMRTAVDKQPMMGKILDQMQLTRECCRSQLLTHVDFHVQKL